MKVEILYFYSDSDESEVNLTNLRDEINTKRADMLIQLINIEDPANVELTELFNVEIVPFIVFLTSKGKIAARKYLSLSNEDVLFKIVEQINIGELPNPDLEITRNNLIVSLRSITKRNLASKMLFEQMEIDIFEADSKDNLQQILDSNLSMINHIIKDLKESKRILKSYLKKVPEFII
jgi:hypothetical protein